MSLLLCCLLLPCCSGAGQKVKKEPAPAPEAQPAKAGRAEPAVVEKAPAGPPKCESTCPKDMYCGFSLVSVQGSDLGQAIRDVKKQARNDLAKGIKMWIRSEMRDSVVYTRDGKEELLKEKINKITEYYVDMGLEGVEVRHEIDDANERVCAFATLSKAEYQKNVASDIAAKVGRVRDSYIKHEEMLAKGDPKTAIDSLLSARKWLVKDFEELPVKATLSGREQEMHAAIEARLSHVIGRLSVVAVEKKLPFGADGKVKGQVVFSVKYEGQTADEAAANMTLAFSFVKGKGRVTPEGVTGRLGAVEARISRVEPGHGNAILRAQLVIPGVDLKSSQHRLPYADVELYKVPAVALLISTAGGGTISGVEDKVKAIVAARGFELAEAPPGLGDDPGSSDFTSLKEHGADNLVVIKVKASGSQPSRADLALGNASATVSLFDVNSRKLLYSTMVKSGRGYGANASAARWKAISKLKPKLYKEIEKALKKHLSR